MTKSISAVGFELEQKQSDMIEKKLERVKYADDLIVDFKLNTIAARKYVLLISMVKHSVNVFSGSAYGLF